MNDEQTKELIRLIRIYVPPAVACQMLGDLKRSKASRDDSSIRHIFAKLEAEAVAQFSVSDKPYYIG